MFSRARVLAAGGVARTRVARRGAASPQLALRRNLAFGRPATNAISFIARLATLVPRPRRNTTIYFGVLAAHAKGRDHIVPCPEDERGVRPDALWAALMKHSFGLDVLACPNCGERMRFVEVVLDRKRVRALLEGLALWTQQLPLHPARGPPPDEHETCDYL